MGIAENTALLLHDPTTGAPVVDGTSLPRVLAGAVVLELVLGGHARLEKRRRTHLVRDDTTPVDDDVLRAARDRLPADTTPKRAVEKLQRHVRDPIMGRLVATGVLRVQERSVLGFVPLAPRWPALDPQPRSTLLDRLHAILVDGAAPSPDEAALVALVRAVKAEAKLLVGNRRELRARSKEIADGDWAGEAVRKAIADVHDAVTASVVAAASVASSG